MVWYNELYASHSNNSAEIKNNAIAYGNSSYILIDNENSVYVNKFYINGYKVYGEKAIQHIEYAYGFKNEIAMYKYANKHNLSYVPLMISYNDNKVSIQLTYLQDYITIRKYFELRNQLSQVLSASDDEFSSRNNYDAFFKALMKLLNSMEKDNFVHNNLTLDNIMIHPDTMDLKVVNLKDSYIFNSSYHKDHTIFNFTKNELLYTLYKVIYPQKKDMFMKYFKYRNPDYYTNNNSKVGDFYRLGMLQLFDEPFETTVFIEDEEVKNFVKNITFFHLYVTKVST
jgi:hypothetical protein